MILAMVAGAGTALTAGASIRHRRHVGIDLKS